MDRTENITYTIGRFILRLYLTRSKTRIVKMKIYFYFFLALISFACVELKQGNRMGLFKKHHGVNRDRVEARLFQFILQKVCTPQMCRKCIFVLTFPGRTKRIKGHCLTIVHLKPCCPQNLLVRILDFTKSFQLS